MTNKMRNDRTCSDIQGRQAIAEDQAQPDGQQKVCANVRLNEKTYEN
jgi:hypothetical protein